MREETDESWVFEYNVGWSKLGTRVSLYAHNSKDENKNMKQIENTMIDNVKDSIIVAKEKNKLVVIKDLDNYMVVNTDDVLMICPKDPVMFKNIITDLAINDLTKYQ